jgi:tyrosyl-tRNA synthetase
MQCTDVFFLDVDICQLGNDQRKVNMLAIEMADSKKDKPIVVSHGMIMGLV